MQQDTLYANKLEKISRFKFDENVAQVFDNMVTRSIPFYHEVHQIIKKLSDYYIENEDLIYDLGCSTGTTIKELHEYLFTHQKSCQFIGVDNSRPMLDQCQAKLKETALKKVQLLEGSIEQISLEKCKMVIMNYTLQFIDPHQRKKIVEKIYQALKPRGIFIFSEKITCNDPVCDQLLTDLYYDFKADNGYGQLEIAQKRQALENFLRPTSAKAHLELLKSSGFVHYEMVFRWYNFATFIGIKDG